MKKCAGLLTLALLSIAVAKVKAGQMRSVCILIPAYDPEEMAEGENEEEEVRGWGPGPGRGGSGPASGVHQGPRAPIVTHHSHGGEEGGGGTGGGGGGRHENPPTSSQVSNAPGIGGGTRGSMTDPSKPPGPNPKWGYWEWDSESRRWELEDFRRKRRQAPGSVLSGQIQCGASTVIHVHKVRLGFSIDNRCRPVRPGCQVTSTMGRQVSHCEGRPGACGVTILQKYLHQHCGRRTNYAQVVYECIAESEQHNICEAKTFQTEGSLVISSPSFSGSAGHVSGAAPAPFLSCECEVNRRDNEALAMPWLRTRMNQGKDGACGDELLLLDTWDDSTNRFKLQEELCSVRTVKDKLWTTSVLKLTYIPGSTPKVSTGFLLRVQGKPDPKAPLQVTCSVVPADGGPSPGAGGPPPPPGPPSPGGAEGSGSSGSAKKPALKLPPNFDLKKYPGLLNRTLGAWRRRLNEQSQQQGNAAGQIGGRQDSGAGSPGGFSAGSRGRSGPDQSSHEEFQVKGLSGTLSAVVASLSSIIVIMGSLGVYLWYRRRTQKKKKQQEMVYYDSRSTVRSNATLYAEPVYQDPSEPHSGIPTSLPVKPTTPGSAAARESAFQNTHQKASETLQKTPAAKSNEDGGNPKPPALPVRPPRTKKEKVRRLPSEEDVDYDNNAGVLGAVSVITDEDYASLDDISEALASQDGGGSFAAVQTEA